MVVKLALAAALLGGLTIGTASAQTGTPAPTSDARSPTMGDPGKTPPTKTTRMHRRAAAIAAGDKQPPGTTVGNAPDRAAAGGGGR